jgi:uncharacterized protein with PIN domain
VSGAGSFDAATRRLLETAVNSGAEPECPDCRTRLTRQRVEASPEVSYVRRRVLVICPSCRKSASLDVKR